MTPRDAETDPAVYAERDIMELTAPATQTVRPITHRRPTERRKTMSPRVAKTLIGAADLAMVCIAMLIAHQLAAWTGEERSLPDTPTVWQITALSIPVWLFTLVQNRLYQARFVARRGQELRRVVSASVIGSLSLIVLANLTWRVDLQRDLVAFTFLCAVSLLMAEREVVRQVFNHLRRIGARMRPVVIVGDNAEARELARMFDSDRSLGYHFVGFVTVNRDTRFDRHDDVIGHTDEIADVLNDYGVTNVMIANSAVDVAMTSSLIRQLIKIGIHVELSPTLPDVAAERLTVRPLGRFPVMYLEPYRQSGWRMFAKRGFDFAASFAALTVLAMPMALLALLVRLDSKGPVLFRQERVGRDSKLFDVLKFRTMVPNAHELRHQLAQENEADGPLFKIKNDPRITRVGRVLRKTSLDELPQLWNVLRGEMSLVGPRPALPEEAEMWSADLRDRLRVQPGITGMWQVSGRSNTSFEEYSRLDLYYVDNWSLLTDLAILTKTVPSVLLQRGAS
ncbi:MAG: sugar transferase [Actinomycetota bacterium]|nr:sugar transferase [Actinomycetota bacterium]